MPLPDPLGHECRTGIAAAHHEGERSQRSIRFIVLHSTEGGTAKSVAEWFANPASGGSSNIVVDDFQCWRSLGDNLIPWGAPPLNTFGFHVEMCGYAAWSRARWLLHYRTLQRSAYKAALRIKWYGIPIKIPTIEELKKDYEASMAVIAAPDPCVNITIAGHSVPTAFPVAVTRPVSPAGTGVVW